MTKLMWRWSFTGGVGGNNDGYRLREIDLIQAEDGADWCDLRVIFKGFATVLRLFCDLFRLILTHRRAYDYVGPGECTGPSGIRICI